MEYDNPIYINLIREKFIKGKYTYFKEIMDDYHTLIKNWEDHYKLIEKPLPGVIPTL